MQEAANKKKCLFGDPKDHNSGNTDSGNPERVFWRRERVRGLLKQKNRGCYKLPGENYNWCESDNICP